VRRFGGIPAAGGNRSSRACIKRAKGQGVEMSDETLTPDLCVVGGSAAGAALAAAAAANGLAALLIAPEGAAAARLRGAGLAVHALAAAARGVHEVRHAARFGLDAAAPAVDFARLRERVVNKVADLTLNESDARLAGIGVRVIEGEGRFVDARTFAIDGREIRARRFVLALSSVPVVPEIAGLSRVRYLTGDTILDLRECPRHLLVIGAGSTGLSLAQSFRRFGAEVTVLDAAAPLHDEDSECASVVLDALAREGVAVHGGVAIERVEGKKGSVRVAFASAGEKRTAEGTHLLVAAGRRTPVEGLGLELAGIELDAGAVSYGDNLRTTNSRVFVIGDAAGGWDALHAARWQGRLVLGNLLSRVPVRSLADRVPRLTATDPELAHVGLREDEARVRHRRIRILRASFFENDRAEIERESEGMVKLVTTHSGRIVGATVVGVRAGESIGTHALAVAKRMHIRDLGNPAFPYPSRGEAGQQAALGELASGLTNRWVQRIMKALRLFD
jgi:pyruvate/2-oxoglutarate dehydrogenase complex dihydrolipoamide dehydrogenase (E3) component